MAVLSEKEKQELALKLALRNTLANKALGKPEQIGPTQTKANAITAKETVTSNSGGSALPENNNIVDALVHAGKSGWNNITHDATSNILNIGEKTTDFVGADKANDVITNLLRQNAADKATDQAKINSQYGQFDGVAGTVNEVATNTVGMAPQIAAFVLNPFKKVQTAGKVGGWLLKNLPSTAVMVNNTMGAGINKALNEGAELEEAQDYGALNAGKEVIPELMFGGVKYLPGAIKVGKMAADAVTNPVAKKVAGATANMASEGAEEAISEIIDPFIQRATYNENAKLDWNDVIHNAMIGALTTGAINASGTVVEKGVNALPNVQKVQQKDQNRAFEALHGQKMGQNQGKNAQNAQNSTGQAIVDDVIKNITNPKKVAQNQTSQAVFEQTIQRNPAFQDLREKFGEGGEIADQNLKNSIDMMKSKANIDTELIGKTLWVFGDTFAVKDDLKNMGFKWSNKRKAWCKSGVESVIQEQSVPTISETETVAENTTVAEDSSTAESEPAYEDYDVSQLSEEVYDFYEQVNELGEDANFNVRIVKGLEHDANGKYDGQGNILISADKVNDIETFRKVVSHEVYHHMKNTDEHRQLQDLAFDLEKLKNPNITREQLVQDKIDSMARATKGEVQLDEEGAWDEIGADLMDQVLTDKKLAEQIWTEAPSLAARIIRAIEDVLRKLKNRKLSAEQQREVELLQQARDVYIEGLRSMKYAPVTEGESRYMFAGVNSQTADHEALARAQQMEASGADMESIRQETGWFKSKVTGGKWAYEIDDSKAGYTFMGDLNRLKNDPEYAEYKQMENNLSSLDFDANPELEKRYEYLFRKFAGTGRSNRGKASDFVSHDALFEAYPQLANMNWYQKEMNGANGQYTPSTPALDMGGFVQINKYAKDPVKTSLHEMQHAIQEIEGFPSGSSAEYWSEKNLNRSPLDLYANTAGEIMARDTASRSHLNAEQRKQKQPAMGDENTVYADGGVSYNIDTGLKAQFDRWLSGDMKEGEYFTLGRTPESLKKFGAKDLPIIMTQDVIVKITGGKHSIALDEVAKLPDQIANPIMLFKGSVPNSFVVLTEIKDKSGNDVVSAIHLNKKQNRLSVNRIASLYGKNNIENYVKINIEAGNLLDADAKKAPMWFSSRGLQLPKLVQTLTNAKNILPESQLEVNGTRYSIDAVGSQEYKDLLDKHGSIPEGENPTGENHRVEAPNKAMDGKKVRQFVRTIMEAPTVDDAVANMFAQELIDPEQILSGVLTMESTSNKARVNAANESINEKGWKQEYQDLHSRIITGEKITAQDIALATRVVQEAQKAGDAHAAFDLLTDLTVISSEFGQGLQAVQILKRLSPEGQLMSLMKTQKRINDNLRKQKRKPVSTMSEETAAEFLQARSNKRRDEIWNREIARMGQETEGNWNDKLNALRYAAMLSNPITHIRNIFGNITMAVAHQPTVFISAVMEEALRAGKKAINPNSIAGEQYRSLVNRTDNSYKELRDYANHVFKEVAPILRSGGSRYSDAHGEFQRNQRVFGDSVAGRVLEQLAGKGKFSVSSVLEGEDMIAKRLAFNSALAGYMKANGISVQDAVNGVVKPSGASLERGKEYAFKQAEKATFTEDNRGAEIINDLERSGIVGKILVSGAMPFKKTPMNILTRGFEYSPAGLAMTFYKLKYAATNSKDKYERAYNMNDVFESLAANMTGTALMYLGYKMAAAGLLAGAGDDDNERKARYDQQMGSQEYAFTDPDTGESWTIDWLAPVAMPLFAGAEVFNQVAMQNENAGDPDYDNMIVGALSRIIEPVFEMSCMQGVSDALASYSSGGTEFASSIAKTATTGYLGQFAPQPMKAAAKVIDDTVRSSYASKESDLPIPFAGKTVESFLRQQRSGVPMLSQQNEPSIDVWGNERKREFAGNETEQVIARTINSFFNPTTYSTDKRTELDKELEKLYKATGNASVLPKSDTNYVEVGNKTYHKTPEEKTAYDKTKGQKSQKYVSDFVKSGTYKNLDNSTKAEIVADLYNLASYEAKKQMLTKRGVWKKEYENARYENVLKSKTSPGTYYAVNGKLGSLYADKDKNGNAIKGSKEKKVKAYLNEELKAGRITDEQWWYFYTKEYSSQAKNAPYAWIREANK